MNLDMIDLTLLVTTVTLIVQTKGVINEWNKQKKVK